MAAGDDVFARRRRHMVADQIARRGIYDDAVLAAMGDVPRHLFVPDHLRDQAYEDRPLPLVESREGQTISQPYIVALMSELAGVEPGDQVLDVGTGSGYQAAVLAHMGARVHTIEIDADLARRARERLATHHPTVVCHVGDGRGGWPDGAPYQAILVAAAPLRVPPALLDQLAVGGRLVIPVGDRTQELVVITRTEAGFDRRRVLTVLFVPLVGDDAGA